MLFGKKEDRPQLDPNNIPVHIAAVMDGNGRWAQKRGLPRTAGHKDFFLPYYITPISRIRSARLPADRI